MNSNMIAFQGLIKLDNIYTLFITPLFGKL